MSTDTEPTTAEPARSFDPDALRDEVPRGARQAPARRRQRSVRRDGGRARPLRRRSLRRADRAGAAHRRGRRRRSSAAASAACSPARGCARPASTTSASSRRAATSAAPGTGTATRARCATSSRTSTCRCSKSSATSRRRSTRARPRSSSTAGRSASTFDLYRDACFQTEVTELRWDDERQPLDRAHQPRRRDAGALRLHGERAAASPEAAGHPRHRDLRGPHLPHQPLGLRLHRRRLRRRT